MDQSKKKKACVRFAQGTKDHDGLSPISYIVETCVTSLFEGTIKNKKQFTDLLLKLIEQTDMDVEPTLKKVFTCLQDLVVRCQKSCSERGAPILIGGGGKGLLIPRSAIVYIQRMILWINRINLDEYFEVEVSV